MDKIIVDDRWNGQHGIGRFSFEIISRLKGVRCIRKNIFFSNQLSPLGFISITFWLAFCSKKAKVFFTPGFNPPIYTKIPYIFTIHDLTHVNFNEYSNIFNRIYYNCFLRYAVKRAYKILTVSEFSKTDIVKYFNVIEKKVVVVGNGVSDIFHCCGEKFNPGYPYLFCLGNFKPHKNIIRIINAFAQAKIANNYKLIIAGCANEELTKNLKLLNIENKVYFLGQITDEMLVKCYRGASAFLFPSLYEGFGLPILEAMACGVPVITSNVAAMPEVAGGASLLVDPMDVSSIADSIEMILKDNHFRQTLIQKGLIRSKEFTWKKTAQLVQSVLNEALH